MDGVGRQWTAAVPVTPRRQWLRIFLVGLALWLATVAVIFLTGNLTLLPTLVLLGSFLVPVTFVAWAFQRRDTGEVTVSLVFGTFLAGGVLGVLGVLASAVLESYPLRPSVLLFLGGVLFSPSGREHFVVGIRLLLAYLGVAVLHALWDAMHVIALFLTLALTGARDVPVTLDGSLGQPTPTQAVLMPALEGLGLASVAVIGVVWLVVLWRSARHGSGRPSSGWRVPTGSSTAVPRP